MSLQHCQKTNGKNQLYAGKENYHQKFKAPIFNSSCEIHVSKKGTDGHLELKVASLKNKIDYIHKREVKQIRTNLELRNLPLPSM